MELYLSVLLDDLNKQKILRPSRDEAPEGAKIIGVLSENLQRLHSRLIQVRRDFERAILELEHCDDEDKVKELKDHAMQLKVERELLGNLFWYEVRCTHSYFEDGVIGLDREWQLYTLPRPANMLTKIMESMFALEEGEDCGDPNCPIHAGSKNN